MNVWRQMKKNGRPLWMVQTDRRDVQPLDEIDIQHRDGTTEKRIVKKIISTNQPGGDLVFVYPRGTPPIKRIEVDAGRS